MNTSTGYLALVHLNASLPLQVMRSQRGYYIGTMDDQTGHPVSRESEEYFRSKTAAEKALLHQTWTQRVTP